MTELKIDENKILELKKYWTEHNVKYNSGLTITDCLKMEWT